MGSTLEHGIYLPSEGEKNCYQGLASNWNKVDGALGDIAELKQSVESKFTKEIVTELPTEDINPFCIYMILKTDPETDNVYDEWVYINNAWEYLGNTQVDMTQYYTKQEVNELPAVASGVTSTKVGNYDTHLADSNIHVTSADKTKWNTVALIKQLRLVNTQVGSATTIAFANIDDTNGIKVGDKCMDLDAKMFEITAVDTTNQTVTVGSALIDLAKDSDVVHNTGNETVAGVKTFSDNLSIYNSDNTVDTPILNIKTSKYVRGDTTNIDTMRINFLDASGNSVTSIYTNKNTSGTQYLSFQVYTTDNNNANITSTINYYISKNGDKYFLPYEDNQISLGSTVRRWKSVYAKNFYYGSDNTEFSTKFVTTDTVQSVSGQKVFTDINAISNSAELGSTAGNNSFKILDKNKKTISRLDGGTFSSGMAYSYWLVNNGSDVFNGVSLYQASANLAQLRPYSSTLSMQLGASNRYFSDCYTSKINGITPSSLSMPDFANRVDIAGYISNLSGSTNNYTPPVNGWLYVGSNDASYLALFDTGSGGCGIRFSDGVVGEKYACIPCQENRQVGVKITCTNLAHAYFVPCQGNV